MANSYYPFTTDGRGHWWQNILTNGQQAFVDLGWSSSQYGSVMADAAWAVYAYLTVRGFYDSFSKAATAYADGLLDGPSGGTLNPPTPPSFPTSPSGTSFAGPGIEARREAWVQEAKKSPNYTQVIGQTLGIEASARPFNPTDYQCQLYGLTALNPHSVTGKFRKAGGQVDSINFYGRKHNAGGAFALLGVFTATPFSASVPVAGAVPEEWEFQARAVRKDVEFGLPSDEVVQVVRP